MSQISITSNPTLGVFVGRFQPYHAGQITLLDLPEGNPVSVYIITPGNVDIFVDGSKAQWSL